MEKIPLGYTVIAKYENLRLCIPQDETEADHSLSNKAIFYDCATGVVLGPFFLPVASKCGPWEMVTMRQTQALPR